MFSVYAYKLQHCRFGSNQGHSFHVSLHFFHFNFAVMDYPSFYCNNDYVQRLLVDTLVL